MPPGHMIEIKCAGCGHVENVPGHIFTHRARQTGLGWVYARCRCCGRNLLGIMREGRGSVGNGAADRNNE